MWLAFSLEFFYHINLAFLGIKPRSIEGLLGILTAPIVHGSLSHLISNSIPILFLGALLFFFYESIGRRVFFNCYFLSNVLVWLFSPRQSYHIGASGLVYGLSSFLIFNGLLRKDFISLAIAVVVVFAYGGIFYGILPNDNRISWESHLAGFAVGIYTAFSLNKKPR
ncbi:MAG: rhomboid family intramembrane serine protease [Flammeovirgaceae bacterium]|nr:rhomboid family intramembrane serine protease [Flammeovirgaceae bacterium]